LGASAARLVARVVGIEDGSVRGRRVLRGRPHRGAAIRARSQASLLCRSVMSWPAWPSDGPTTRLIRRPAPQAMRAGLVASAADDRSTTRAASARYVLTGDTLAACL